jgi:hypothetical protein
MKYRLLAIVILLIALGIAYLVFSPADTPVVAPTQDNGGIRLQ